MCARLRRRKCTSSWPSESSRLLGVLSSCLGVIDAPRGFFLTCSFLMGSPPGKLVNAEENARCRGHRKLALAVPVPWRGEEPQLHGSAECRAADPRRSTTAVAGDERSR